VLKRTISPRYIGISDRLTFANRSYITWAKNIFVRSRSIISCIFEAKFILFLLLVFSILDIVVVWQGGPKLIRG
jgi:hypothetical protein